jgi:uncharacterized protein
MDVSLILTHRCNLDCGYCYAGEHHGDSMDDETLDRSVDLLFADDANPVQLSFFGGEPFLAFDAMKRATLRAERRAAQLGRKLILQCTTNGYGLREEHIEFIADHAMHVTVSIDGVREAQELNRPRANGNSSFERVRDNLRKLAAAGTNPDAMMVISPATARYAYRSASFLWGKGIRTVRANMQLDAPWSEEDKSLLREELLAVSSELVARRLRGEQVSFEPFEKGIRASASPRARAKTKSERAQVVVATTGNLYPCAPMVGPDRDDGPEAAIRIGHLDQGVAKIVERAHCEGTQCHKGGGCQCAAYLETGNRFTAGPNGRWYAQLCLELGGVVAAALAHQPAKPPAPRSARPILFGIAATIAAAAAVPMVYGLAVTGDMQEEYVLGELEAVDPPLELPPEPIVEPDEPCEFASPPPDRVPEPIPVPGGLMAPPEPPPEPVIGGDFAAPPDPVPEPEVMVDGEMAMPPAPEPEPEFEVHVRGKIAPAVDER